MLVAASISLLVYQRFSLFFLGGLFDENSRKLKVLFLS